MSDVTCVETSTAGALALRIKQPHILSLCDNVLSRSDNGVDSVLRLVMPRVQHVSLFKACVNKEVDRLSFLNIRTECVVSADQAEFSDDAALSIWVVTENMLS